MNCYFYVLPSLRRRWRFLKDLIRYKTFEMQVCLRMFIKLDISIVEGEPTFSSRQPPLPPPLNVQGNFCLISSDGAAPWTLDCRLYFVSLISNILYSCTSLNFVYRYVILPFLGQNISVCLLSVHRRANPGQLIEYCNILNINKIVSSWVGCRHILKVTTQFPPSTPSTPSSKQLSQISPSLSAPSCPISILPHSAQLWPARAKLISQSSRHPGGRTVVRTLCCVIVWSLGAKLCVITTIISPDWTLDLPRLEYL